MCGIVGTIGTRLRLDLSISLLRHRGPDHQSEWTSAPSETPVALGHARLAIVDLSSDGDQPMHSSCGRYVIVFNGEIHNFIELRKELEGRGVQFRTLSDTEVLLQGLMLEGPDFQLKCNGMWAFCLWDRQEGSALLGRDRFGEKPLFYTSLADGAFAFASEMKGLFPFMRSVTPSRSVDQDFQDLLRYEATAVAVIEGIRKIPAGHWASWKRGVLSVCRWWNTLDHIPEAPLQYEEQVERWRELFLDSIRIRLRADVPVGTTLSGGLDSSSVLCGVAHLGRVGGLRNSETAGWQKPVCASFGADGPNETPFARMAAEHVGAALNVVTVDPLKSGWSLQEALFQVEDPYLTLPLPMLATYRAIRESGTRVTLDGHGADELLSGYGHLRFSEWDATQRTQLAEVRSIVNSLVSGELKPPAAIPLWEWLRHRIAVRLRLALTPPVRCLQRLSGKPRPPLAQDTFYQDQSHPRFQQMDWLTRSLFEAFHSTFLPTLLRNYDRYSMASGVEIRMPFMDWRLVSFAFALPWTSRIGAGFTKRILRDSVRGLVPDPLRSRRDKIGWNSPKHVWFRGPLRAETEEILARNTDSPWIGTARAEWTRFLGLEHPNHQDGENLWTRLQPVVWSESLNRGSRGITGSRLPT